MPIYEYECRVCGERFGILRPMRELDEPALCPKCGDSHARRVVSLTAAARVCAPSG